MTALVFIALMAFSVVLAFMAKRGVIADSMDDVMVAGALFRRIHGLFRHRRRNLRHRHHDRRTGRHLLQGRQLFAVVPRLYPARLRGRLFHEPGDLAHGQDFGRHDHAGLLPLALREQGAGSAASP